MSRPCLARSVASDIIGLSCSMKSDDTDVSCSLVTTATSMSSPSSCNEDTGTEDVKDDDALPIVVWILAQNQKKGLF